MAENSPQTHHDMQVVVQRAQRHVFEDSIEVQLALTRRHHLQKARVPQPPQRRQLVKQHHDCVAVRPGSCDVSNVYTLVRLIIRINSTFEECL